MNRVVCERYRGALGASSRHAEPLHEDREASAVQRGRGRDLHLNLPRAGGVLQNLQDLAEQRAGDRAASYVERALLRSGLLGSYL